MNLHASARDTHIATAREVKLSALRAGVGAPFDIELYSDPDDVADAWRAFEVTACGTLFQSHRWISAWCRHAACRFGEDPLIVVGRDRSGTIAFIWPMAIVRRLGDVMLTWLGQSHSGYGFGLYRPDVCGHMNAKELSRILTLIAKRRPDLSAIHLIKQPVTWDGRPNPFASLPRQPSDFEVAAFDLGSDFEALYRAKYGKKTRHNHARLRRRLDELGDLKIGLAATASERRKILDVFQQQKAAQFAKLHVRNVFADPAVDRFYRALASDVDPTVDLDIGYLSVGDEVVATDVGMRFKGRAYGLNGSITEGEMKRHSPGVLLMLALVERYCDEGAKVYDFGPGAAQYKAGWHCYDVPLFATCMPLRAAGLPAVTFLRAVARSKAAARQWPRLWLTALAVRDFFRKMRRVPSQ